jgi:hypothetical protein
LATRVATSSTESGSRSITASSRTGDHLGGAGVAIEVHPDVDKGGGADGHESIGPQPTGALPVLPFGPDQSAQHERSNQADQRIEKVGGRKIAEGGHLKVPSCIVK